MEETIIFNCIPHWTTAGKLKKNPLRISSFGLVTWTLSFPYSQELPWNKDCWGTDIGILLISRRTTEVCPGQKGTRIAFRQPYCTWYQVNVFVDLSRIFDNWRVGIVMLVTECKMWSTQCITNNMKPYRILYQNVCGEKTKITNYQTANWWILSCW